MKHYTRKHNHNELNTILALNSNEVKSFAYGDNEEVLTIKEQIALDEQRAIEERERAEMERAEEEKRHAEYLARMEEDARIDAILEKHLSTLESDIDALLSKGSALTIEDLAIIGGLLDEYSDTYKEINYIRPRWYIGAVNEQIKRVAPLVYAQREDMWEKDLWWDFACGIQRAYWENWRKEHNK